MMKHSVLDDSLIRVRLSGDGNEEVRVFTLPQVLHTLAQTNDLLSFEALQAHQRQAWYSFLVQLAAMAVARGAEDRMPDSPEDWCEEDWRRALLALSEKSEAAWHLVVEDVKQPAFMQPPVREGSLSEAGFKTVEEHADKGERSLDSFEPLITSKNHSVKRQRVTDPNPDHWIYALCNTQTMSGYVIHYQRIARVSGGYSSRPFFGLSSDLTWSTRFQRDLRVLLEERSSLDRYNVENGHTLLWMVPWSGQKEDGLPLYDCDPYFIEVSRRLRLVQSETGEVTYRKGTNPGMRIKEPPDLNGVTGDVWTPIDADGSAVRIAKRGVHYGLLHDVLLGADYERPPALQFREGEDGLMHVVAEALGRDQGKTRSLHRRIVPVPPEVTNRLGRGTLREELAERSRDRIAQADLAKRKVLYATLTTLLLAGRNQRKKGDGDQNKEKTLTDGQKRMRRHQLDALDQSIDEDFFKSLWASAAEDLSDKEAQRVWHTLLWEKAERCFGDAQGHAPTAAIHSWRARSAARSMFERQANRYLKHADQARASSANASVSNSSNS